MSNEEEQIIAEFDKCPVSGSRAVTAGLEATPAHGIATLKK